MLNLKEKELFDKKISIINNKRFRDSFIASQVSDINEWDVGLVALWNTPVLYYELRKAYPNKKFYYIETEALKDVYGVDTEDTIYIKEEEELADIMKKFKNPKLLINPPYSIGGKVIAKCKKVCPEAKYSILMPLAQYKSAEVGGHRLSDYINTIEFVGGEGFDASITNNNCIVTLSDKPIKTNSYFDFMLQSFDQRYIEFYLWNINNNKGLKFKTCLKAKPEELNINTDFLEINRCCDIIHKHGYYTKFNANYKWNLENNIDYDKWIGSLVKLTFEDTSGKAKYNYSLFAYNWTNDKRRCLASKTMAGINAVTVSEEVYMFIPQIDWANIHLIQKALWDQGLYDEAVLAEMGLKWDGDTIVRETN